MSKKSIRNLEITPFGKYVLVGFLLALLTQDLVKAIAILLIWVGIEKLSAQWSKRRKLRGIDFSKIDKMDGHEFEYFVGEIFSQKGYKADVTPGSNDFGIDIIARAGRTSFAVQVKRYNTPISRSAVSDAVAGKAYYGCDKAMVVTNNYFTKSAQEFAKKTDCYLVDRDELAEWIRQTM